MATGDIARTTIQGPRMPRRGQLRR